MVSKTNARQALFIGDNRRTDVKPDGKVWLQHDGTDLKIALMLVERGIPKSSIVLGFHAPSEREMIEDFAVA